jgi:hypothetical protein
VVVGNDSTVLHDLAFLELSVSYDFLFDEDHLLSVFSYETCEPWTVLDEDDAFVTCFSLTVEVVGGHNAIIASCEMAGVSSFDYENGDLDGGL